MDLTNNNRCFACGADNPIGLRLSFSQVREGVVEAKCTLRGEFQGWAGISHGGITAALLDEAMAYAALNEGIPVVTAKMEVRYRRPVPVETELILIGEVISKKGRAVETQAKLVLPDGKVGAEASGIYMPVDSRSV